MKPEEGYIKETLVIYRPALIGRKYLNVTDYEITEKDGKLIIEPIKPKSKD